MSPTFLCKNGFRVPSFFFRSTSKAFLRTSRRFGKAQGSKTRREGSLALEMGRDWRWKFNFVYRIWLGPANEHAGNE